MCSHALPGEVRGAALSVAVVVEQGSKGKNKRSRAPRTETIEQDGEGRA